jgi:hypothetical protein
MSKSRSGISLRDIFANKILIIRNGHEDNVWVGLAGITGSVCDKCYGLGTVKRYTPHHKDDLYEHKKSYKYHNHQEHALKQHFYQDSKAHYLEYREGNFKHDEYVKYLENAYSQNKEHDEYTRDYFRYRAYDVHEKCSKCLGSKYLFAISGAHSLKCKFCNAHGEIVISEDKMQYTLRFACESSTKIIFIGHGYAVKFGNAEYKPCNFWSNNFIAELWKYAKAHRSLPKIGKNTFDEIVKHKTPIEKKITFGTLSDIEINRDEKLTEILSLTDYNVDHVNNKDFWDDMAARFHPMYNDFKRYSHIEI